MDPTCLPIPTPFAVGRVNCYLVAGETPTLVDPGPASADAHEALVAGLADAGHDLADVERVLVTHPHMDHYGNVARVVAESGAEVCAHPDAVDWLADPDAQLDREQALFEELLVTFGVPAELAETAVGLPDTYREFREPVAVDRGLSEGETVRAGDHELSVLSTPGHAPGSVCLAAAGAGVFTGDHLLGHISPNPLLTTRPDDPTERTRSLPAYLASLEKLAGVDAPVGWPGHGDLVTDVAGRVAEIVGHHREREERVADLLAAEGPLTPYEVTTELFPDLPATELFPGVSEAVGHLDLLEDDGRVTVTQREGVRHYDLP